jgi:hypothetical protein
VVILGEYHRIREDVAFVTSLIPQLYEAGVRTVGIEFACTNDQARIDTLITDALFNEQRAVAIQRRYAGGTWPYREYLDLYKAAWDINRHRAPGDPPFRLIALSPYIDWYALNHGDETSAREQRLLLAGYDQIMAAAVEQNSVAHGGKMLVYCGYSHAFSGFEQPVVRDGELVRLDDQRMGNILRQRHGNRVITVLMHAPWPDRGGDSIVRPCNGVLDLIFSAREDSTAFDVPGTPFADLPDTRAQYAVGHQDFRFGVLCDGYVQHKPIKELTGVTVITSWIATDAQLEAARRQFPDAGGAEQLRSIRDFLTGFQRDAAIQTQFQAVK